MIFLEISKTFLINEEMFFLPLRFFLYKNDEEDLSHDFVICQYLSDQNDIDDKIN